jgi:hypothetical protein
MDTTHWNKRLFDLPWSITLLTFSQHVNIRRFIAIATGDCVISMSVNRSQMDTKPKICDTRTWKKLFISRHIHYQHDTLVPSLYQCVEIRSIEVSWRLSQPFPRLVGQHLRISNVLDRFLASCEPLYVTYTSHHKEETFYYEYPLYWVILHTKNGQQNAALRSILLKDGRHFDYWNQPLNIHIRVCYLDCHESELCYYLVIHVERLLRLLQLFAFHLWPIYWISLLFIG